MTLLDNADWQMVNDGVMGGISGSTVTRTDAGTWLFSGIVSLENNGGFASAQAMLPRPIDLSQFNGLALRVRGDGNRYGFNARSVGLVRLSYRGYFETTGDWQQITFAFADLQPITLGNVVPDAPPLDLTQVQMLGFIIADKQDGPFSLEIDTIRALPHN
ncbi:MAG: CIA30 family protein [Chloroflexota bacterium]